MKRSTLLASIAATAPALLLCLTPAAVYATPPSLYVVSQIQSVVSLTWGHEGYADEVTIERESPAWHWYGSQTGPVIFDSGLLAGTTYRYMACAWYSGTPDCTEWVAVTTRAASPPTPPPGGGSATSPQTPPPSIPQPPAATAVMYGITLDLGLEWMRHDAPLDGRNVWAPNFRSPVGAGWDFKQVIPGYDGTMYAVTRDNDLLWYRHQGNRNGTFDWHPNSGAVVGHGWDFKHVFSGCNGTIYAIAHNGDLLYYAHQGIFDGAFRWNDYYSGTVIGRGFGNFLSRRGQLQVFSGCNGVIYGITQGGDLMWYKHLSFRPDKTMAWANGGRGKRVGNGWSFAKVFNFYDVIYAIGDDGKLRWYRHLGSSDGTFRWAPNAGSVIGSGWYPWVFTTVFAGQ